MSIAVTVRRRFSKVKWGNGTQTLFLPHQAQHRGRPFGSRLADVMSGESAPWYTMRAFVGGGVSVTECQEVLEPTTIGVVRLI